MTLDFICNFLTAICVVVIFMCVCTIISIAIDLQAYKDFTKEHDDEKED